MTHHVNITEVTNTGGVYIGDVSTNLEMEEVILRVAKKAFPQYAKEMSTPTLIPGAYRVYGVGTNGDVTILVWSHNGDFSVTCNAW